MRHGPPSPPPRPSRGRASAGVPENTFASFDLALKHGCDGFEFDVRLTACGTAVVCHDPKVGRITVARAQASSYHNCRGSIEVIKRYGERAFLDIELKVKDLESKVLTALERTSAATGLRGFFLYSRRGHGSGSPQLLGSHRNHL